MNTHVCVRVCVSIHVYAHPYKYTLFVYDTSGGSWTSIGVYVGQWPIVRTCTFRSTFPDTLCLEVCNTTPTYTHSLKVVRTTIVHHVFNFVALTLQNCSCVSNKAVVAWPPTVL